MIAISPYIYFIVLSLLMSLRVFSRNNTGFPYLRTFPVFLVVTLSIEYLGNYLSAIGIRNLLMYNLFSILECCYFQWLISRMIVSRGVKRMIRAGMLAYAVLSFSNISFYQVNEFHTITYSLGCLLIVIECIYFFLELFRSPKAITLVSNPNFWICSSLLFWYSCGFPLYGFLHYWSKISPLVVVNFESIVTILNIFFYLLFTIAFLCMKPRKYISSQS